MPTLDCSFFPHIWDSIIHNLDPSSKLKLRMVCSALKQAVDEDYCGDWLRFEWRGGTMVANGRWDNGRAMPIMPFFSPWSPEGNAMQQYAVELATNFWIETPSRPWILDLLQERMDPKSYVLVTHKERSPCSGWQRGSNTLYRFPCYSVALSLDFPCPCTWEAQPMRPTWEHSASELKVFIKFAAIALYYMEHSLCLVIPQLLTATVTRLCLYFEGTALQVMEAIARVIFARGLRDLHVSAIEVEVTFIVKGSKGPSVSDVTDHIYKILLPIGFRDIKIVSIDGH